MEAILSAMIRRSPKEPVPSRATVSAPKVPPSRAPIQAHEVEPDQPPTAMPFGLFPFSAEEMRDECLRAEAIKGGGSYPRPLRISASLEVREQEPCAAVQHAYLFVQWLLTLADRPEHVVPARDLQEIYPDFCRVHGLEMARWQSVALYLNFFTGEERGYRRIGGKNTRVYPVPSPSDRLGPSYLDR